MNAGPRIDTTRTLAIAALGLFFLGAFGWWALWGSGTAFHG